MTADSTSTKLAIVMAMDKLCSQKPYEAISAQEICDLAKISRSTFYRAFESKYSIATWYQDLITSCSFEQIGRTYNWHDGYMAAYDGYLLAPGLMSASKMLSGLDSTNANIKRNVRDMFLETLRDYHRIQVDDALMFQLDYFLSTNIMVNDRWSIDAGNYSPEELIDMLLPCIPKGLFDILNKPVDPKPYKRMTLAGLMTTELHTSEAN